MEGPSSLAELTAKDSALQLPQRRKMEILFAIMLGLFLAALTAVAGPLSKAQIPATAKWVMHVDIDQLAASQTCAVLTNNPALGVARHADAGYEKARRTARKHKIKIPK